LQAALSIHFLATRKWFNQYQVEDILEQLTIEQHALKNINNCLNTNIYSYLDTSGGQSSNPHLNVVHFLNTRAD
jgi:hypothetical protein